MALKAPALWLAGCVALTLTACNPASPPNEPMPGPAIPPVTPAAAGVAMTTTIQAGTSEANTHSSGVSCAEERGTAAADALVQRCIFVSPATRPPCNASNPCALIESEIKRGCDFFAEDEKPAECSA